jgi:hypothetical protein
VLLGREASTRAVRAGLMAFCLGACTVAPGSSWGPLAVVRSEIGPDALATGIVMIEPRCVLLQTNAGRMLLVWPAESTSWMGGAAVITFKRPNGGVATLRGGDPVSVGGGLIGDDGHRWSAARDPSCGGQRWLVSDVQPE